MRVVINGLAALKPKTGVGHHVASLTRALAEASSEDAFALYPGGLLAGLVARFNRPPTAGAQKGRAVTARAIGFAKEAAKAASRLHFAAYTRAFRFDLYHEPNFVPYPSRLPTVVTVHDLSVLRFPQWHPADRVRLHETHFRRGLERAVHVITVSEAVRREVISELDIASERVTAVPNGINPSFHPLSPEQVEPVRRRLGLPGRYFLCVGTVEPRKNILTAMRAFADLPTEVREGCPLVLAGPWGWKAEAERDYFETVGRHRGVRPLGYVADADLPAVYAGAVGLVYPSHYEGFGLPPVEMLAMGGPVLASTDPAVREVCGPHADFIDPNDLPGWRAAMLRLATDSDFRNRHTRGGPAQAARFTWKRAARETLAVYRHVLGHSDAAASASARPAA